MQKGIAMVVFHLEILAILKIRYVKRTLFACLIFEINSLIFYHTTLSNEKFGDSSSVPQIN
jgi:hypothetical protein